MSFFTLNFLLFIMLGLIGYYTCPKKWQWLWLLGLSYFFYSYGGIRTIGYIVVTTLSIWYGALLIDGIDLRLKNEFDRRKDELSKEQKKELKKTAKRKKQLFFWVVLILNFGVLSYLKYFDFILQNITGLFAYFNSDYQQLKVPDLLLPLGISFYTFQSTGYLIDIYRGKYRPETNPLKFGLFVSFFPQIIQGPIGRFDHLSEQLYKERDFIYKKIEYGVVLMLWGYFKKLLIADHFAIVVNTIFDHYTEYSGSFIIVGVLSYSIQQYADFSGGIDIVSGIAQMFGVELAENFRRPYFSKSLAEFWRRWHISLGAWMRDYIFYPLSITKTMAKLGKVSKKYLGNSLGRAMPVCVSNIVVFFLVGLWHGANWHYIVWGLYNGIVIAVSALLEPIYRNGIERFRINTSGVYWKVFQILRTFLIVNIGWYFDRGNYLKDSLYMLKATFLNLDLASMTSVNLANLGLSTIQWTIAIVASLILLSVSILQEKGVKIRDRLINTNIFVKWAVYLFLFFMTIGLQANGSDLVGGFMYAHF